MGQMQATHSVIYSDPSLCFHTELWMELKPKTVETIFFCGCGGMREEEQGEGERGQLWWNAPGMSSLGSRASSFQTADSAASSSSQGRSLVKCKMSNGCESLPSLPLPFSVFLLFFYLIFLLCLQHEKAINGKFGKPELPSDVWWCHQIESS